MIVVLTGPTGSGKTKLAIQLAKKIDAEIINADAFQVYEELSIATAKPSKDELEQVPHHLIGFVPLTKNYDVSQYQIDARNVIEKLQKENKNIVIAGGTGLYIKAALYNYLFEEEKEIDMSSYESLSNEELYKKLSEVDPESASSTHQNNRQRVLRALKVFLATGKKKSDKNDKNGQKLLYPSFFFEIDYPRENLYPLVEKRVEDMFENGIVEENSKLVDKYGRDPRAFCAIGVKEFFPYYDGQITLDQVKQQIKDSTRHYIKRQETFFRNQFAATKIKSIDDILEVIYE